MWITSYWLTGWFCGKIDVISKHTNLDANYIANLDANIFA